MNFSLGMSSGGRTSQEKEERRLRRKKAKKKGGKEEEEEIITKNIADTQKSLFKFTMFSCRILVAYEENPTTIH